MSIKVLHQNCDKSMAKNKELPRDSYLVGYLDNEDKKFDIVQAGSRVSIFDEYYDKYRNVQSINWIDILKNEVPIHLKQYIKIYDLRSNKNRNDDILFTIDLSNN